MSIRAHAWRPADVLPAETTPLLGRERECAQLREVLDDPSIRLVTLTGPGGVGKTRLALSLARDLADAFDDAVAFVPLAAVRDAELVLPAIAQELGLFGGEAEDQLVDLMGNEPALLVLDNLEQVPDAAPVLARLLVRGPRLTMLVTSRTPLGIAGEQLFALPPLPVPSAEDASIDDVIANEAVTLFAQRARSVAPAFAVTTANAATIADICRRLDGLPLAIELAATRTRILSPEALLARLSNRLRVLGGERRDAPDRLRTMRNAIAWSYDLLAPDEQAMFRRLAVFRGGFSLAAAESIFTPVSSEREAFDVLSALVDHSLVQPHPGDRDEPRFLMLETLRDFGLEQLGAGGEEPEVRLDHATWVAALAHLNETTPIDQRAHLWANVLDPDIENIRAAAAWSLDHGHPELAMTIGADIWNYCANRGLIAECRGWLERAFETVDEAAQAACPEARYGAGALANFVGDEASAQHHFEVLLAQSATTGRPSNEFRALAGLGAVAVDRGEFARAMDYHHRALTIAIADGRERNVAMAYGHLGNVAYAQGKLDNARAYYEQCRERFAALGHAQLEAVASSNIGAVMLELREFDAAEHELQRALALKRSLKALQDLPDTLINLGRVARARADHAAGRAYLGEAVTVAREHGLRAEEALALATMAAIDADAGDTAGAATLAIESANLIGELEDAVSLLELAESVAGLSVAVDRPDSAAELLAAATTGRAELDAAPTPLKQAELATIESASRSSLNPVAFDAAWNAGIALDRGGLIRRIALIAREIAGPQQPAIAPVTSPDDRPTLADHLTPREIEVLRMLVDGRSTADIAVALYIAPRTVGTHIANLLGKLGVSSRTAAVALALRAGIA